MEENNDKKMFPSDIVMGFKKLEKQTKDMKAEIAVMRKELDELEKKAKSAVGGNNSNKVVDTKISEDNDDIYDDSF